MCMTLTYVRSLSIVRGNVDERLIRSGERLVTVKPIVGSLDNGGSR